MDLAYSCIVQDLDCVDEMGWSCLSSVAFGKLMEELSNWEETLRLMTAEQRQRYSEKSESLW